MQKIKSKITASVISAAMILSALTIPSANTYAKATGTDAEVDELMDGIIDDDIEGVLDEGEEEEEGTLIEFTEENFPNENFREKLKAEYEGRTYEEITRISYSAVEITDFTGVELFPNLKAFCYYNEPNEAPTKIDLSKNTLLEELRINCKGVNEINLSGCNELAEIHLIAVSVDTFDTSNFPKLWQFILEGTEVTEVDLSNNQLLRDFYMSKSKIKSVDLSMLPELETFMCHDAVLEEVKLPHHDKLQALYIKNTNVTSLDLSGCTGLWNLAIANNKLNTIDLSDCRDLWKIEAGGNNIKELDISYNDGITVEIPNHIESTKCPLGYDYDAISNAPLERIYMSKGYTAYIADYGVHGWQFFTSITSNNTSVAKATYTTDSKTKLKYYKLTAVNTGSCVITLTDKNKNIKKIEVIVIDENTVLGFNPTELILDKHDNTGISGKVTVTGIPVSDYEKLEYKVSYSFDNGETWITGSDWKQNDNSFEFKTELFGTCEIKAEVRVKDRDVQPKSVSTKIEYHPIIKGNVQLPYGMIEPGEPGYLIGLETYPDTAYSVEMLILDCTSMQWVYSTGENLVPENMLWTVWQPQYGYYWTLFRAYDQEGNMIDEVCYGFENIV